MAVSDPEQAARFAHLINFKYEKVSALCAIARLLAEPAPALAGRLLDDAEGIAQSITQKQQVRAEALLEMAHVWIPAQIVGQR